MARRGLNIINDEPITNPSKDLYHYDSLAYEIARCISAADASNSSFTICINGIWGSGKTSLINLIENCIDKESDNNLSAPTFVRFNPWHFESQEQLLTGFFQLLKEALLGRTDWLKDTERKTLGETLSRYSTSISFPSITEAASLLTGPLQGIIASGNIFSKIIVKILSAAVGRYFTNSISLDKMKATIDDYLRKRETNIVVVIDDIDRLSDSEICLIFKLVTLTASFPHIVYLLAFDRAVVEKALCNLQRDDGAGYLDKIIQLSIEMPRLSSSDISQQINLIVSNLQKRSPFSFEDQTHLSNVLTRIVSPLICAPRDICRIKNCAETNSARLHGDICVADLIALSTIQTLLPDLYSWLWDNARAIFNESRTRNETGLKHQLREDLNRQLCQQNRCNTLDQGWLGAILPPLSSDSDSEVLNWIDSDEAYVRGRISNRNLFNLFFSSRSYSAIARREFNKICTTSSASEIRNAVCTLRSRNEKAELAGQLMLVVPSLDIERCRVIAQASLLIIAKHSPLIATSSNDVRESFSRLFNSSAKVIGKPNIGVWITDLINSEELDANSLLYLLRDENLSREKKEASNTQLLTDSQFINLARLFSSWMDINYRTSLESADRDLFTMWKLIDNKLDFNYWAKFEKKLSTDLECTLLYSSQQMTCWTALSKSPNLKFEIPTKSDVILPSNYSQTIWTQEWYPRLSNAAKLFLAAFYLTTTSESSSITESEASELVQRWDSLSHR